MAQEMVYNKEEMITTTNLLNNSLDVIEKDIAPILRSEFNYLKDLGFYGLEKLSKQVEQLSMFNSALIAKINGHTNELDELEQELTNYINQTAISGSKEDTGYAGDVINVDDIDLQEVNKGKKINNDYLEMVTPIFTYSEKLALLKNINNDNAVDFDFFSLLTDPDKSNVLVCELKKILGDSETVQSEYATDEEKNIQKIFLNSMADSDNNCFAEFENDSILKGMPYLKEVAKNNNITVGDLVLDDTYSTEFMTAVKDIYNGTATNLSDGEVEGVKSYVNSLALKNNLTVEELLTISNANLIKGGY